jgi:hypothetical protein
MKRSTSSESLVPDSSVITGTAIGAQSRPLRFLIVALVVAVYMALGFLLHLNAAEYQVLGVPMLLAFQYGIQHQPLRTVWVRSGPPLRLDAWFFVLWVLFSLIPIYDGIIAAVRLDWPDAAFAGCTIAGAFGLAYALRAMHPVNWRQLALCLVTVGIIDFLLAVSRLDSLFQGSGWHVPALLPGLQIGGVSFFFGLPASFAVEEVFFRGALDTYLHRGEQGTGWLSAFFVSALWGLWHLPIVWSVQQLLPASLRGPLMDHLLPLIALVLVGQIAVGVPLSLWWRQSGNLVVTGTTHALIDAVRNVFSGIA